MIMMLSGDVPSQWGPILTIKNVRLQLFRLAIVLIIGRNLSIQLTMFNQDSY